MQVWKQWSLWMLLAVGTVGTACDSGGIVEAPECEGKADLTPCADGTGFCSNGVCEPDTPTPVPETDECAHAADGEACDNGNGTCEDGACKPNATPHPVTCGSDTCGPWQVCNDEGACEDMPLGAGQCKDNDDCMDADKPVCIGADEAAKTLGTCVLFGEEAGAPCTPGYASCAETLSCEEAADGSGTCLIELSMHVELGEGGHLSPINRALPVTVTVSGFESEPDDLVRLNIVPGNGLNFSDDLRPRTPTSITFEFNIRYDDSPVFPTGKGTVSLEVTGIEGYALKNNPRELVVDVRDGLSQAAERVIWLNTANLPEFTNYVHTAAGQARHYLQTEDVDVEGTWTPIGSYSEDNGCSFSGSFDGGGYNILSLKVDGDDNDDYQGMFACIGTDAVLKNIGLISGANSYIIGNNYVGALVGYNDGGTVESSYAVSEGVLGNDFVGGLVGYNNGGTVEASYAAHEAVLGNNYVGGVVGYNNGGTVQHCMGLNGTVEGDPENATHVGRVVGSNVDGTLASNYGVSGTSVWAGANDRWADDLDGTDGENMDVKLLLCTGDFPDPFNAPRWAYEAGEEPSLPGGEQLPEHLLDDCPKGEDEDEDE